MENRQILISYLIVWLPYVVCVHGYAWGGRLRQSVAALSHAAPSLVAISMTYIFLIRQGATVAQFVAGSEEGVGVWSLWVSLWPMLLLATFAAGGAHLIWLVVACVKRQWRAWVPVALAGIVMSGFAFVTVAANFPDA
jgi:hypothetical protein